MLLGINEFRQLGLVLSDSIVSAYINIFSLEGEKDLIDEKLCVVNYCGQKVSVSLEIAEFLRKDDLYIQAQKKKEQRHWDMRRPEEINESEFVHREKSVEDRAIDNYFLSKIAFLSETVLSEEIHSLKEILVWYYCDRLSMEAIGSRLGISKAAVSKRHKKILKRMREEPHLTNVQVRLLLRLTKVVLVSYIVGGNDYLSIYVGVKDTI